MTKTIRDQASNPSQYDDPAVRWSQEGHGLNPIRRMFLERLSPYIGNVSGADVLDLGCGQGWLSHEIANNGGNVIGIDPSVKNIQAAKEQHPGIRFEQSDLQSYHAPRGFDLITAVMVFEHFSSLAESFAAVRVLLKEKGRLLMIAGDFDKFTHARHGYSVETQEIVPGEVATRTDYGDRVGVVCDINRTTDRFISEAEKAGLQLGTHEPIMAPEWLIQEQSKYEAYRHKPTFQLFEFVRGN
jgi:2-polyprenyl-3-methyl-5-hydroxy-6-metoxy-1,4-benzoquinol methylase